MTYARPCGIVYKVVRLPDRELRKLCHIDVADRVMFVVAAVPEPDLRSLVEAMNRNRPPGLPDERRAA